ncbi:MAG TPA: hypothetical protein VJ044_11675 [Candidatus Hodarchaeales archaeon]|nr:hypothetical protein [Candidatus Hodarchaeales archaeon]
MTEDSLIKEVHVLVGAALDHYRDCDDTDLIDRLRSYNEGFNPYQNPSSIDEMLTKVLAMVKSLPYNSLNRRGLNRHSSSRELGILPQVMTKSKLEGSFRQNDVLEAEQDKKADGPTPEQPTTEMAMGSFIDTTSETTSDEEFANMLEKLGKKKFSTKGS